MSIVAKVGLLLSGKTGLVGSRLPPVFYVPPAVFPGATGVVAILNNIVRKRLSR